MCFLEKRLDPTLRSSPQNPTSGLRLFSVASDPIIRYFKIVNRPNKMMIRTALGLAGKVRAKALMIYVDPLEDLQFGDRIPKKFEIFLLSRKKKWEIDPEDKESLGNHCSAFITLPKINLTRQAVIKVATTLAMSQNFLEPGDKILYVVGSTDLGLLDHLQVLDTSKESEIITTRGMTQIAESVEPEVFQAVLTLSMELADKGREGKPVGTIFVVGDHEKVLQLSKQMIINPFKGYDEEERNILHPDLRETIREFAAVDGAFVVSGDGIVITAGRYLGAAAEEENLPRGLGSRHIAASGITSLTKAVAFVISESSGDLRIFKDGKIIMEIEKSPLRH